MALRQIRVDGDDILRKKCKEVNFDVSVKTIKDKETIKKMFKKGQPDGI